MVEVESRPASDNPASPGSGSKKARKAAKRAAKKRAAGSTTELAYQVELLETATGRPVMTAPLQAPMCSAVFSPETRRRVPDYLVFMTCVGESHALSWEIRDAGELAEFHPGVRRATHPGVAWEGSLGVYGTGTACLLYTSPSPRDRG